MGISAKAKRAKKIAVKMFGLDRGERKPTPTKTKTKDVDDVLQSVMDKETDQYVKRCIEEEKAQDRAFMMGVDAIGEAVRRRYTFRTTPKLRKAKKLLNEAILDWAECHPEDAWKKWRLIQSRLRTVCEASFDIGADVDEE